jgi:SAM-dependent methyltransferase
MFRRFRQWFFARCLLPGASAHHERLVAAYRRDLFAVLKPGETIVELGPGTGANFPYMPPDALWTGVEPNPHLSRALVARGYAVHESISQIPSAVADTVICTLVLCSVADVAEVLSEVRRVLKPGGKFLFLEHVGAPEGSPRRRTQERVRSIWRWFGDGCDVCRATAGELRRAGFTSVEMKEFEVPELGPAAPHIFGTARNGL